MIEIPPITPEDAAAVGRLPQQLGYAVQAATGISAHRPTRQDRLRPDIARGSDRRVLGFIAMHVSQMVQYERPVMRVTALVVDCRARRRGIGMR